MTRSAPCASGAATGVAGQADAGAPQFNPDQIDQWVFNRWGVRQGAKSRLDANLALRIDDLDRACAR